MLSVTSSSGSSSTSSTSAPAGTGQPATQSKSSTKKSKKEEKEKEREGVLQAVSLFVPLSCSAGLLVIEILFSLALRHARLLARAPSVQSRRNTYGHMASFVVVCMFIGMGQEWSQASLKLVLK